MMKLDTKKLAVALAALVAAPLGALAAAPAAPPAPGDKAGPPADVQERIEKRVRVARALGLAEALDLDAVEATRLADALDRLDQKRKPAWKEHDEAMQVLRQAARGDKDAQSKVDDAVKKVFQAHSQLAAIDREAYDAVVKGLSPEKRARAAIFLGRFQHRFGRGMGMMGGPGMGGPGMGGPEWGGPGMRGMGMGPGMGRGMGRGMGDGGWGRGPGPWGHPEDCPCRQ